MCVQAKIHPFQIVVGTLLLLATGGFAKTFGNDFPTLGEVLPLSPERVRDIDLHEDWMENTVVVVGTPDDDKISAMIEDGRIRFRVDGDNVGRINLDDLPNPPEEDSDQEDDQEGIEDSVGDLARPLIIIVSGGAGNDNIRLEIDPSNAPSVDLRNRAIIMLYGDEGDDTLTSINVNQVLLVGGMGTDLLMGDGARSTYAGCEMLCTDIETLQLSCMPDMSMDIIIPGHPTSTAYRNYYQQIEPVTYHSPRVTSIERTPKKLPNIPVIASREKLNSTIIAPTPIEFDSILLDQDRVINKIGCNVQDISFTEDGSTMVFTDVE